MKRLLALAPGRLLMLAALAASLFLLGGCGPASPAPSAEMADQQATKKTKATPSLPAEEMSPSAESPTPTMAATAGETSSVAPDPTVTASVPAELPDSTVSDLLSDLLNVDGPPAEALETILESGDQRFVSVLLELMRARQIGLISGSYVDIIGAMETLSGQAFGDDWPAWIEWFGGTDLEPPPGFTGWKGQLLSRIDAGFADFLRDEYPSRIRVEEILWGGVPVDGMASRRWRTRP